jgi:hypothetical protein
MLSRLLCPLPAAAAKLRAIGIVSLDVIDILENGAGEKG